MMHWRLLDTPPAPGAWNMALDQVLMESVRGGADPVLRFYRWGPRCLSLGRNQPARGRYDEEALRRSGTEVVRRPTGGRAVLHDRELTYAVVAPQGLLGSPREAYALINRALVAGLRELGVPVMLQPRTGAKAPVPSLAPCFREPVEGEVVLAGKKLVGSAQYREGGVMLQHGSLLLENSQGELRELLQEGAAGEEDDAPAVLCDHLRPLPSWSTLVSALVSGWKGVVGGVVRNDDVTPAERTRAHALRGEYASAEWVWRR